MQVFEPESQVPPMPGHTLAPFMVLISVDVMAKTVATPESTSETEINAVAARIRNRVRKTELRRAFSLY
jgi:hypothetical protein